MTSVTTTEVIDLLIIFCPVVCYLYSFSYETTAEIAEALRLVDFTPKLGIICGTGLGLLGDKIEVKKRVPFEEIPHFSKPSIEGHAGEMIFGILGGLSVVCMRGRFHYYEGYPVQKVWMQYFVRCWPRVLISLHI